MDAVQTRLEEVSHRLEEVNQEKELGDAMVKSLEELVRDLRSQLKTYSQNNAKLAADVVESEEEISRLKLEKEDILTRHRQEISLKDADIDQLQQSSIALTVRSSFNPLFFFFLF